MAGNLLNKMISRIRFVDTTTVCFDEKMDATEYKAVAERFIRSVFGKDFERLISDDGVESKYQIFQHLLQPKQQDNFIQALNKLRPEFYSRFPRPKTDTVKYRERYWNF